MDLGGRERGMDVLIDPDWEVDLTTSSLFAIFSLSEALKPFSITPTRIAFEESFIDISEVTIHGFDVEWKFIGLFNGIIGFRGSKGLL